MIIRPEKPEDAADIRAVVTAAFKEAKYTNHTEAAIVEALRAAKVLTVSRVAFDEAELVGHIAFSPVKIDDQDLGWYGLGPVSVRPDKQGRGIGSALVRNGLEKLTALDAKGCVLLGEPEYYGRFGFRAHPELKLADVPSEYFLALPFTTDIPQGWVRYHKGFGGQQ